MSGQGELWARLLGFILLLIITAQVVSLRRILHSRAWNLIASGFVVFLLLRTATIFDAAHMTVLLVGGVLGYVLIVLGLHELRKSLEYVLRRSIIRKGSSQ